MTREQEQDALALAKHIEILNAQIRLQEQNQQSIASAFEFANRILCELQAEKTVVTEKLKDCCLNDALATSSRHEPIPYPKAY